MPVDFLTESQERSYGRYAGEPTAAQLTRYFYLDETDHELISQRRGEQNKLGFALQLSTVRFLGTFLPNPVNVPEGVPAYIGAQLGIDPVCLPAYMDRRDTRMEHALEIKTRLTQGTQTSPREIELMKPCIGTDRSMSYGFM
jgi:hypothetical protein